MTCPIPLAWIADSVPGIESAKADAWWTEKTTTDRLQWLDRYRNHLADKIKRLEHRAQAIDDAIGDELTNPNEVSRRLHRHKNR